MTLTAPQRSILTAIKRGARQMLPGWRRVDLNTLRMWGMVKKRRNGWVLTGKGATYV